MNISKMFLLEYISDQDISYDEKHIIWKFIETASDTQINHLLWTGDMVSESYASRARKNIEDRLKEIMPNESEEGFETLVMTIKAVFRQTWKRFATTTAHSSHIRLLDSGVQVALVGAGVAALLVVLSFITFKEFLDKGNKVCRGKKGIVKDECLKEYRIKGRKEQIKNLKKSLLICNKAKDSGKCKAKIRKKIVKVEKKLKNITTGKKLSPFRFIDFGDELRTLEGNIIVDKYIEADVLVDSILEQGYSIAVSISHLQGNAEVEWTECYNRRCKTDTDDFARKECKAQCQWRALNLLISKLNGQRSRCRQTSNVESCIKTLQSTVDLTREKQRKVREQIAKIRTDAAEFRRKETQRT